MGADAELDPGGADGAKVGIGEVFLAEMDEIAAFLDSELPIIIDHQLRAIAGAYLARLRNLAAQLVLVHVFGAKLHQFHALRQQARQPGGAVDDEVERIDLHERHCLFRQHGAAHHGRGGRGHVARVDRVGKERLAPGLDG